MTVNSGSSINLYQTCLSYIIVQITNIKIHKQYWIEPNLKFMSNRRIWFEKSGKLVFTGLLVAQVIGNMLSPTIRIEGSSLQASSWKRSRSNLNDQSWPYQSHSECPLIAPKRCTWCSIQGVPQLYPGSTPQVTCERLWGVKRALVDVHRVNLLKHLGISPFLIRVCRV